MFFTARLQLYIYFDNRPRFERSELSGSPRLLTSQLIYQTPPLASGRLPSSPGSLLRTFELLSVIFLVCLDNLSKWFSGHACCFPYALALSCATIIISKVVITFKIMSTATTCRPIMEI